MAIHGRGREVRFLEHGTQDWPISLTVESDDSHVRCEWKTCVSGVFSFVFTESMDQLEKKTVCQTSKAPFTALTVNKEGFHKSASNERVSKPAHERPLFSLAIVAEQFTVLFRFSVIGLPHTKIICFICRNDLHLQLCSQVNLPAERG